ncbi:MAG: manganese efflux pump [Campylobacteraceae bacterium]|nr:manganese efflux pump [Campylobacteraceae bacterium]
MELFLLAFGLSMDSVALCIANGAKCLNLKLSNIIKISFIFAFFQGLMPVFGYFLGASFYSYIASIDHFIAFFILSFLGIKMIKDAKNLEDDECVSNLGLKELVLGAIATSIDAMAVGVTFAFGGFSVLKAIFVIFIVCFLLCVVACYLGKKMGEKLKDKALILGGLVLIGIGVKILITHLFLQG